MVTKKYEHLIKPLSVGLTKWDDAGRWVGPGNASREIRLNGRDHLEGLNLNFSWGLHTGLGDWHGGLDPHVHPYPECLLFVGLDTANVNYLGAEVDCCLGAEQEIYTFNEPTVIVIPAGLPHGPITTKRMYSPRGFGFWAVELNSISEITWLGEGVSGLSSEQRKEVPDSLHFAPIEKILRNKPTPSTGKYAHLVKSLSSGLLIERGKYSRPVEETDQNAGQKPGPGNPNHLVCMRGEALEGLNANIFWGFCSRPGIWRRGAGAHVHPADEVLVYAGVDPDNIDYLGAEIEFDLGKEHERHLINKPSVVVCPAGMPHLPQVTRWVDRPFAFFAINLSGEHKTKSFD
jgi:hypothetical protein